MQLPVGFREYQDGCIGYRAEVGANGVSIMGRHRTRSEAKLACGEPSLKNDFVLRPGSTTRSSTRIGRPQRPRSSVRIRRSTVASPSYSHEKTQRSPLDQSDNQSTVEG